MNFSEKLYTLRKKSGLSQEHLGVGVDYQPGGFDTNQPVFHDSIGRKWNLSAF